MPGMYLGGMGGAKVSAGAGYSNPGPPASATQQAFGVGSGMPSKVNTLAPNDPFGLGLWTAVFAVGVLLFIRHSLPA